MLIIWVLDPVKNKHTLYCGKDCMKKFCSSLREHAKVMADFEKINMLLLTKEELKSHQDDKVCCIFGKRILTNLYKSINYQKVRDHSHIGTYRGVAHSICSLKLIVSNEIPVVFHNGSNYDYHFIIKEFVNEGKFECLGENTEKYKTFSVPIEKQVIRIDKDGNESVVTISYKMKII